MHPYATQQESRDGSDMVINRRITCSRPNELLSNDGCDVDSKVPTDAAGVERMHAGTQRPRADRREADTRYLRP